MESSSCHADCHADPQEARLGLARDRRLARNRLTGTLARHRSGHSVNVPPIAGFLVALLALVACGPGTSVADVDRSRREFELAAALHDERNTPGAVGHLRRAIELDDQNPEAHLLLGLIEYERRSLVAAEEHARRGVELLVEQERQGATLAEARNVLGVILIEREKMEEAAEILRVSAMDPMNTSPHLAWGNLGLALLEQGQREAAIEPLTESVRIQPRFCVGYHRLGRVYYELEQFEPAEEALVRALEVDEVCERMPQMQNAWRLRAEVRAHLGHHSDAVSDLERCIALSPDSDDGQACQRLLDSANEPMDDQPPEQLPPETLPETTGAPSGKWGV